MTMLAWGLSHKTAPITIREQIAPSTDDQKRLLQDLLNQGIAKQAMILTTCNRTEVYCDAKEHEVLPIWFEQHSNINAQQLQTHSYSYRDETAIRHTIRVACGLDSMMLGEPQILGQMKQAYRNACQNGTISQPFHQLFHRVFAASKRIRTDTAIGKQATSIAFAAVTLIRQLFQDLTKARVMLVGSGDTVQSVANYLQESHIKQFMIANRSHDRGQQLAEQVHGQYLEITHIPYYLEQTDILICATACPISFINQQMVREAMQQRDGKPMFLLDLSVPRDVDANVAELKHVHLYNIDDLQNLVAENISERQLAAKHAELLITEELNQFDELRQRSATGQLIRDYRDKMTGLSEQELTRAMQQLKSGQSAEHVLKEFHHRLSNKLMHHTTLHLRGSVEE